MKSYLIFGFSSLLLAIVLGAFGAHMWADSLVGHESTFELANDYQIWVSLYILLGSILLVLKVITQQLFLNLAIIGMILFSGSLYILSFPAVFGGAFRMVCGPLTPIGGIFLICSATAALTHVIRSA